MNLFSVYQSARQLQSLNSGLFDSPDVVVLVGNMINIPSVWMKSDSANILVQCKQLLSAVNEIRFARAESARSVVACGRARVLLWVYLRKLLLC